MYVRIPINWDRPTYYHLSSPWEADHSYVWD